MQALANLAQAQPLGTQSDRSHRGDCGISLNCGRFGQRPLFL